MTNQSFPSSSPFNITLPADIASGTYNGTIAVTNANNCGSATKPFR